MQLRILKRREDGGIEIEPPKVASPLPMPAVIAQGNALRREMARKQGRRCGPVYASDYPVDGGWGYTKGDACIIRMKGAFDDRSIPPWERDGYEIEQLFVERRIYEEIISNPAPDTPDLHNLRWNMTAQRLVDPGDGRKFDEMEFEVSGFLLGDFETLRDDWESHEGYENDEAGRLRHLALAASKRISYTAVYWFDVTSFLPRGG